MPVPYSVGHCSRESRGLGISAKSRVSVQSQSHQRTKIIHRSWDADTQPLPMTFLCRRVRQHQPWLWQNTLCLFAKVWGCQSPLEAATQTCLVSLGLRRYSALLLCNQSFFMQLLLQCCLVRSDYYGGWKTLLFLTAGSRLNGLKRIFRSSCFHKAIKSVVTTAKTVCLCFGHCFSLAFVLPCSCKWKAESFFHKHSKLLVADHPGSGTTAFQKVISHEIRKHNTIQYQCFWKVISQTIAYCSHRTSGPKHLFVIAHTLCNIRILYPTIKSFLISKGLTYCYVKQSQRVRIFQLWHTWCSPLWFDSG